ncbi:peptidylprolyl isomerase, partial [Sphingomonas sp.]|uniref:peptidylprolyl isomerase n=1 Tax=Sphingomonas sp. TaxID=28214 RepID=UPI002DBFF6F8
MPTMLLLLQAAAPAPAPAAKAPSEIVAAAPASDWVDIAPDDLLVMQLAPDRDGNARKVVIQLMPPPFSQPWIANIRTLAKAHWWDGTAVTRVQDNYVAQWGDPTEKKPLPAGMRKTSQAQYESDRDHKSLERLLARMTDQKIGFNLQQAWDGHEPQAVILADPTSLEDGFVDGWPIASKLASAWPIHCYGMVGVGRNLPPDAGSGAELYTVIGHAPRHLDRNIALVGRVVEGIENLSS